MSLLSAITGNANTVPVEEATREVAPVLIPNERVEHAYRLVRDLIIFTDKRLILVDKQGLTGRKASYLSVPYGKISYFSIETAGTLDMDSELKVTVSSGAVFGRTFGRGVDVSQIQKVLATYVL